MVFIYSYSCVCVCVLDFRNICERVYMDVYMCVLVAFNHIKIFISIYLYRCKVRRIYFCKYNYTKTNYQIHKLIHKTLWRFRDVVDLAL